MEQMQENEKMRLNKIHEAILNNDISDKTDWKYKKLKEILDDQISETEKIKLLVKTIHEMNKQNPFRFMRKQNWRPYHFIVETEPYSSIISLTMNHIKIFLK